MEGRSGSDPPASSSAKVIEVPTVSSCATKVTTSLDLALDSRHDHSTLPVIMEEETLSRRLRKCCKCVHESLQILCCIPSSIIWKRRKMGVSMQKMDFVKRELRTFVIWSRLVGLSFLPDDNNFVLWVWPVIIQVLLWHTTFVNTMGLWWSVTYQHQLQHMQMEASEANGSDAQQQQQQERGAAEMRQEEPLDPFVVFLFFSASLAITVSYTVLRIQWYKKGATFGQVVEFHRARGGRFLRLLRGPIVARLVISIVICIASWLHFTLHEYISKWVRGKAVGQYIMPGSEWEGLNVFVHVNVTISAFLGYLVQPMIAVSVAGLLSTICQMHTAAVNCLLWELSEPVRIQERQRKRRINKKLSAGQISRYDSSEQLPLMNAVTGHSTSGDHLAMDDDLRALSSLVQGGGEGREGAGEDEEEAGVTYTPQRVAYLMDLHRKIDSLITRSSRAVQLPIATMSLLYFITFLTCAFLFVFLPKKTQDVNMVICVIGVFITVGISCYWLLRASSQVTAKCRRLGETASLNPCPNALLHIDVDETALADGEVEGFIHPQTETPAYRASILRDHTIVISATNELAALPPLFPPSSPSTSPSHRDKNEPSPVVESPLSLTPPKQSRSLSEGEAVSNGSPTTAPSAAASSSGGPPCVIGKQDAEVQTSGRDRAEDDASVRRPPCEDWLQQVMLVQFFSSTSSGWRVYDSLITPELLSRVVYGSVTIFAIAIQRVVLSYGEVV
ncbi:unnamed protein product [Vitrella brassicaformis CCMP3155]|uniref:Transmembrane protein n=2 Tax=Vitrella brassicaformis TaxID=1169539 RepID=A0A0G4FWI7_VITBC|nr:unnamed protein product [Vitrella brassicaformis CCMP3155]|eukprot:CEM19221.1 unnamed protein product [Vitrella brassicaformis CCMP3155]